MNGTDPMDETSLERRDPRKCTAKSKRPGPGAGAAGNVTGISVTGVQWVLR